MRGSKQSKAFVTIPSANYWVFKVSCQFWKASHMYLKTSSERNSKIKVIIKKLMPHQTDWVDDSDPFTLQIYLCST